MWLLVRGRWRRLIDAPAPMRRDLHAAHCPPNVSPTTSIIPCITSQRENHAEPRLSHAALVTPAHQHAGALAHRRAQGMSAGTRGRSHSFSALTDLSLVVTVTALASRLA